MASAYIKYLENIEKPKIAKKYGCNSVSVTQ